MKGVFSIEDCRDVADLFDGLNTHIVSSKSLIERPHWEDGYYVEGQILAALDDGNEIELCLWTDTDLDTSFWDVSMSKKLFEGKSEADFLAYLARKGVYLETVKTCYETRYRRCCSTWHYLGTLPDEKVFRIQYREAYENEKKRT